MCNVKDTGNSMTFPEEANFDPQTSTNNSAKYQLVNHEYVN